MTQIIRYISLEFEKYLRDSKVVVSFDSARPNFAPYGFTCEVWTPVPMKRPDRHNEIELNLLKRGELHYLLGGEQVVVKAGQLALFWAAIPHQIIRSLDQAEYYVATIPLAWFLQCQFPEAFTHALLHGKTLFDSNPNRSNTDLEHFAQWVRDLRAKHPARRRLVMLEMEARLLRFALSHTARKQSSRTKSSRTQHDTERSKRIEQIAAFIAQNYTRKLTAEEIGAAVKLHPNYAMNLFKTTFGISLGDYITQHRVTHAQRLLATTDDKIVDVALASGFNSTSRFNEAFGRICRCSPREYRRQHRLG